MVKLKASYGDGKILTGMRWGWGKFDGDGDSFIYHVTLCEKHYSKYVIFTVLLRSLPSRPRPHHG